MANGVPPDQQYIYGIMEDHRNNPTLQRLEVTSVSRWQVRTKDSAGGTLGYHHHHRMQDCQFTPQRAWQVYIAGLAQTITNLEQDTERYKQRLRLAGKCYADWKREEGSEDGEVADPGANPHVAPLVEVGA